MERRLVELESCLEGQILRNNALEERLCKLENHERTTGIKMSNPQDPRPNPSMDCPKPAPPSVGYECSKPPVGSGSQESGKPPQVPTRSVQSRCDEDKPPEMIASFNTKARSGTSICQEPIPHSEEAEKIGTPYHKEPKRYVGKRKLWGTRFFETEESIKGKIERVLEGKGDRGFG